MHWDSNPLHCLESGIDCDSWVNGTFYNIHVIRSSNAILWLLISVSNWIFASTVICRMLQEETWFKNLAKVMIPMWELWSAWVRNPCAISDCFLQVMMVPRHCWGQHLRLPPKGGSEILKLIARNIEIYCTYIEHTQPPSSFKWGQKYWDLWQAQPLPFPLCTIFSMGATKWGRNYWDSWQASSPRPSAPCHKLNFDMS